MKSKGWLFAISLSAMSLNVCAEQWIRINQLGYLPQSRKVAVFMSEEKIEIKEYALIDAFTGKVARTFATPLAKGKNGQGIVEKREPTEQWAFERWKASWAVSKRPR